MHRDDLVRMVNQIARFFEPYPEDEAVAGVAEHLRKFWDPRMRVQLMEIVDTAPELLHPLSLLAAEQLRGEAVA